MKRKNFQVAFFVGGDTLDILSRISCRIYAESPAQRDRRFRHMRDRKVRIIPKHIELPGNDPSEKDYDIIAVGKLKPSKQFELLKLIPDKYSVAVIGSGPEEHRLNEVFSWALQHSNAW